MRFKSKTLPPTEQKPATLHIDALCKISPKYDKFLTNLAILVYAKFGYLVYILQVFIDFYIRRFNLFKCACFCLLYVSILFAKKSNGLPHLSVKF